MASLIKSGESLFIPFRAGHSISDSQLKPRMYKTREAFQRSFPGYYKGTYGVELVEYAPVVRCKDCKFLHDRGYCTLVAGMTRIKPDDYCSRGERRNYEAD